MRFVQVTILLCLLSVHIPVVAAAQTAPAHSPANPAVASARPLYDQIKGYILKSAEQMSDANYGFQPTPEVRTFGQIIGHLANDQYLFCSSALGEKNPEARDIEKTQTTKAGFGDRAPLSMLILNVAHDDEHYGNIVTYMRIKGMVPPSSQPSR